MEFNQGAFDMFVQLMNGKKPGVWKTKKKIKMLVANGSDTCVVDKNGNNLLMVAVLIGQGHVVTKLLIKAKANVQELVTLKNKAGHNVVALFLNSARNYGGKLDSRLVQLVELGANITSTDNNGDNCLHHLVRCPVNMVKMYNTKAQRQEDPDRALKWRKLMFKKILDFLTGAGADNSQQNKSGLIPLQVALSAEPIIFESILDLEPLVPTEYVLEQLVPRPDALQVVKEPLNLAVKVWLVARVTKFGFHSSENILSIVQASKYCNSALIEHVLSKYSVRQTVEDLKVPCGNLKWDEIEVYIKYMLPKDISDLNLTTPDIIGRLISFDDNPDNRLVKQRVVKMLASNGYSITVSDNQVTSYKSSKPSKIPKDCKMPYTTRTWDELEVYAEERPRGRIERRQRRKTR